MADWTDIPTNNLLPGEPWTSAKAIAAFENPEAIAEGAPDAPRVQADSMQGSVAGDTLLFRAKTATVSGSDGSTPFSDVHSTTFFRATTSGEVRVRAERISSSGGYQYRIVKNDVAVATTSSASSLEEDISFVAGDLIWVEARGGTGAGAGAASGSVTVSVTYRTGPQRSVGGI